MIHFKDCVCVRCCALRVEQRQMAIAEELAGRENAWREARPHFGPRAGTKPAIDCRYGGKPSARSDGGPIYNGLRKTRDNVERMLAEARERGAA